MGGSSKGWLRGRQQGERPAVHKAAAYPGGLLYAFLATTEIPNALEIAEIVLQPGLTEALGCLEFKILFLCSYTEVEQISARNFSSSVKGHTEFCFE